MMLRLCWYVVCVCLVQGTVLAKSGLRYRVAQQLVAVTATVLLSGGVAVAAKLPLDFRYDALQEGTAVLARNDIDLEQLWRKVRNNSPAQYKSVFYLLLDGFDVGWRVMHIEYIGDTEAGEPLFIGPRAYLLNGEKKNGEPNFVLNWAQPSLVGHRGLIEQNVEVEEITHFSHPYHKSYDQTLITIKDVNLRDYEPITVAAWPEANRALTMLSYRVSEENLLKFFNYPLEQRDCHGIDFDTEDWMVVHSCHIPSTPAVIASPIFFQDKLVALYYGVTNAENAYGSALLPGLLDYLALDVSNKGKATTTWGTIKRDQ